jgi:hypothetical protein
VPLVFRKIEKAKWYKTSAVPWLAPDALQADALSDLSTKGNKLSVYLVEDELEALKRLIAALAANRDFITKLDYALFQEDSLSNLGIRVVEEEGDTPDHVVNTWHRNLSEITVEKIVSLAEVIKNSRKERVLEKRVRALVIHALASNQIDSGRMKLGAETIADLERSVCSN